MRDHRDFAPTETDKSLHCARTTLVDAAYCICADGSVASHKMHTVTFFPLGNADCTRIDLEDGTKILFDFANIASAADQNDRRCNLAALLREDLAACRRDSFDVVAITHLDRDHFGGASEFFYLEHAKKYQDSGRVKINELWVPSGLITEKGPDDEEARIMQSEARHRFIEGKGIRVFSRPDQLSKWAKSAGVRLEERMNLITDAGKLVPGFSTWSRGIEFFVHSPFAIRQDENTVVDRNGNGLIVHVTFRATGVETKMLLLADADHQTLSEIVEVTRSKGNEARLQWDICKVPHHCSYRSIGEEKGVDATHPTEGVQWLYEQAQSGAIMVSSSKPTPNRGTVEDEDVQPPHRQAANYYRNVASETVGQFIVTMEHPKSASPEPIVIEISGSKGLVRKRVAMGAAIITGHHAPRAGADEG